MKIGFNLLECGMGNNGGTKTIINTAKALKELGHDTYLISKVDKFTWFDHDIPVQHIPEDLDVLVATSCKTVGSTIKSNAKIKAWYIRGHEIWAMKKCELTTLYKSPNIIKITNSIGLKKQIEGLGGTNIHVVYQGVDINFWKDLDNRGEKIRIGCLYNVRHKEKRWDAFMNLYEKLGDKYEFVAFGDKKCNDKFLTEYIIQPTKEQLRDFYSKCHIWFAPTTKEGLHNPPLEAGLCGCLLVCSDHPNNGMIHDYAFKDNTAMVYSSDDEIVDIIKTPKYEYINNLKTFITTNIKTCNENMKIMEDIFKEQL